MLLAGPVTIPWWAILAALVFFGLVVVVGLLPITVPLARAVRSRDEGGSVARLAALYTALGFAPAAALGLSLGRSPEGRHALLALLIVLYALAWTAASAIAHGGSRSYSSMSTALGRKGPKQNASR